MLSFAEEILLFTLDDQEGVIKPLPASALAYVLPGALLMELAFINKIDVDLKSLRVVDAKPAGNALLDDVLGQIEQKSEPQSISYWLFHFTGQARQIQERVLQQLIAKGVLKIENKKILWVFNTRRYPMLNNREIKEVTTRLRDLIRGDEIPDPRDAILISLVDACHLFDNLFSAEEFERVQARITALAKLDLIGQEITKSIQVIAKAMTLAIMS